MDPWYIGECMVSNNQLQLLLMASKNLLVGTNNVCKRNNDTCDLGMSR